MESGTLYQLRNLLNRRNVVSVPLVDMNACEDFFYLVVTAHVISAAMGVLGMSCLSDSPNEELLPDDQEMTSEAKNALLFSTITPIMTEFFNMTKCDGKKTHNIDGVQMYACDVFTLGLFYMELFR